MVNPRWRPEIANSRIPDGKHNKENKKANFLTKIEKWANRESSKAIQEASSGVELKFSKSGKPYVEKNAKSKTSTKLKGWAKLGGPGVGAGAATSDPVKEARKKKKLKRSK